MNAERIKALDRAWSVYKEYLGSMDHILGTLTFAEWLHCEYEKARKEDAQ